MSLGMAPQDITHKNEKVLWEKQYGSYLRQRRKRYRYQINETVRVTKLKRAFQRGYEKGWQKEIFQILDRFPTRPLMYKLSDLNGEVIEGTFYERELGKVVLE